MRRTEVLSNVFFSRLIVLGLLHGSRGFHLLRIGSRVTPQLQRMKPPGMQANEACGPRSSVVVLMVLVTVNHCLAWRSGKELVGCGMDSSRKGSWRRFSSEEGFGRFVRSLTLLFFLLANSLIDFLAVLFALQGIGFGRGVGVAVVGAVVGVGVAGVAVVVVSSSVSSLLFLDLPMFWGKQVEVTVTGIRTVDVTTV